MVFPVSSPRTLKIWKEATLGESYVCLRHRFLPEPYPTEAYEQHVYDYINSNRQRSLSVEPTTGPGASTSTFTSKLVDVGEEEEPTFVPSRSQSETQRATRSESPSKADAFKLRVRWKSDTVSLSVRPTTQCKRIVAAALKKMGKAGSDPNEKGRIEVDGEALEPDAEIGEAELEADDLVDIVGL